MNGEEGPQHISEVLGTDKVEQAEMIEKKKKEEGKNQKPLEAQIMDKPEYGQAHIAQ